MKNLSIILFLLALSTPASAQQVQGNLKQLFTYSADTNASATEKLHGSVRLLVSPASSMPKLLVISPTNFNSKTASESTGFSLVTKNEYANIQRASIHVTEVNSPDADLPIDVYVNFYIQDATSHKGTLSLVVSGKMLKLGLIVTELGTQVLFHDQIVESIFLKRKMSGSGAEIELESISLNTYTETESSGNKPGIGSRDTLTFKISELPEAK